MQENSDEDRSLSSLHQQRVTTGPCPPGANNFVVESNIKQGNTETVILESDGNSENIHGQRRGHGTEI